MKDVIKSGGEWISSVDLEDAILQTPGVAEVGVIGIADERWQERPLAVVVLTADQPATAEQIRSFLQDRVAKFWVPEYWSFVSGLPKTSVGKLDKKRLRSEHSDNQLTIEVCRD
jgi:fatty-acyl-CoA synthase